MAISHLKILTCLFQMIFSGQDLSTWEFTVEIDIARIFVLKRQLKSLSSQPKRAKPVIYNLDTLLTFNMDIKIYQASTK